MWRNNKYFFHTITSFYSSYFPTITHPLSQKIHINILQLIARIKKKAKRFQSLGKDKNLFFIRGVYSDDLLWEDCIYG